MLSKVQLGWLEQLFADCEKCTQLNEWERRFVNRVSDNLFLYKENTKLSERQIEVCKNLYYKVRGKTRR